MGEQILRREDKRFLTGKGRYLDDIPFDNLCHAVALRSPHAHAAIQNIDTSLAKASPGVIVILLAEDLAKDEINPIRPLAVENPRTGEPFAFIPQPLLAHDRVRFVGEALAIVVAETKLKAIAASELIEVSYQPLPAVVSSYEALASGAPRIAASVPGNLVLNWETGDSEAIEQIFDSAAHLVELKLNNHRVLASPLEPRGVIGIWDSVSGQFALHVSSQSIHAIRDNIAEVLGIASSDIRVIAHDVGGGFGTKNFPYPEYALVAWASKRVKRPVKWIATRSEGFLTDHQARDHQSVSKLALDAKGNFIGLHINSVANLGAYLAGSSGAVQIFQYANLPGTVYSIPNIKLQISAVLTNTTPIGVTRAPGYAEANFIIERLIDLAADQCDFDRIHLRRQNMYSGHDMPFTNAVGQMVDSGSFEASLDAALNLAGAASFEFRRARTESKGRLRGLGIAYHIKGTGGSPHENVDIRFEENNTISLIMGTQTIGQGHETTFPQIVSDRLGISNEKITLYQGDTNLIAEGGGHGSSRSTYMGGTAIWRASEQIVSKGVAIAAKCLEAPEVDICFQDGCFLVAGTDRTVHLFDVAAKARQLGLSLNTYHAWTREAMTYPNGAHVAEIEIDRDTGKVTLELYTAVDDYGVLVNPMIVSGQMHGAIAQGLGQSLLEYVAYDSQNGQPLMGSFMDYALPRADDLIQFSVAFNPTRCLTNPLGVKGCGEAGASAAPPAIANAIVDALKPFGVRHFDGVATPERIWEIMNK